MVNETLNQTANVVAQNNTVGDAMIYIANKLGVATTELVTIYAQVQAGLAVVDILTTVAFWIVFGIMGIYFLFRYVPKLVHGSDDVEKSLEENREKLRSQDITREEYEEAKENIKDDFNWMIVKGFLLGILTIALPFIIANIVNAAGIAYLKVTHPEYYAIQQLLGQFASFR